MINSSKENERGKWVKTKKRNDVKKKTKKKKTTKEQKKIVRSEMQERERGLKSRNAEKLK